MLADAVLYLYILTCAATSRALSQLGVEHAGDDALVAVLGVQDGLGLEYARLVVLLAGLAVYAILEYVPEARRHKYGLGQRYVVEVGRGRLRVAAHVAEYEELLQVQFGYEAVLEYEVTAVARCAANARVVEGRQRVELIASLATRTNTTVAVVDCGCGCGGRRWHALIAEYG